LSQEPEKIKLWREEQRVRLQTKDAEEETKKKEWKEAAKKELEDWYKNRQEQLAKTHASNKYVSIFF
jgi:clathrin light chain A